MSASEGQAQKFPYVINDTQLQNAAQLQDEAQKAPQLERHAHHVRHRLPRAAPSVSM